MFSFLNKPYPHTENFKRNLIVSFCIGTFVALFLIVFQPFGLSAWQDPDKKMKLLGYGLVSFIIPIIMNLFFTVIPDKEKEDNWKVWKEIVVIVLVVLAIAAGNLFYSDLVGVGSVSFKNYLYFIFITFSIGVFPISVSVASKYNRFLKLNEKTAGEVNTILEEKVIPAAEIKTEKLTLVAENGKDKLELDWKRMLYIESADNYSVIHYMENEKPAKQMLRGSLKRMEEQCTSFPALLRCHRAFIVNSTRVSHVEGNAAGYKLSIQNTGTKIPVSRNYGNSVIEKLRAAN